MKKPKETKEAGSAEELAALFPESKTVTFRVKRKDPDTGKVTLEAVSVDVFEMDLRQRVKVAGILRDIGGSVQSAEDYFALMDDCGEELIAAIAVAIDRTVDEVGGYPEGGAFEILLALMEVNANFQTRQLPVLAYVMQAMKAATSAKNGVGAPPSPSSAATESPTQAASH